MFLYKQYFKTNIAIKTLQTLSAGNKLQVILCFISINHFHAVNTRDEDVLGILNKFYNNITIKSQQLARVSEVFAAR